MKEFITKEVVQSASIKTVYDICNLYWKLTGSLNIYDKETFELSVLCGNVVVIIDGVDEFISIFQEKFDLSSFISSISDLNEQLGKSKIILTSRCHIFEDVDTQLRPDLKIYVIQGFNIASSEEYIEKRFSKFPQRQQYKEKVIKLISEVLACSEDKRILPFLVDLICTSFENHEGPIEQFDFKMSLAGKEYRSNSDLVDSIVFSTFRREMVRHEIELGINEVVGIFRELTAEYGNLIPVEKFEEYVGIFFEDKAPGTTKKILVNPLLSSNQGIISFRYSFLSDYFVVLYILEVIGTGTLNSTSLMVLSKLSLGEGQIFKDVVKFYIDNQKEMADGAGLTFQKISQLVASEGLKEELVWKVTSAILHLYSKSIGISLTRSDLTDHLKKYFNPVEVKPGLVRVSYLYIYGDFPSLDFENLEVWHSRFVKYTNFAHCKFNVNTKFNYCYFDGVITSHMPSSLSPEMFDQTCRLGDLTEAVNLAKIQSLEDLETLEVECKKFLRRFVDSGRFKTKQLRDILFKSKEKGINIELVHGLLKSDFLVPDSKKKDAYGINSIYQKSVYSFIVNNLIDNNIRKVISAIKNNR